MLPDALDLLHPTTRAWFRSRFAAPTQPQTLGWPAIAAGGHVLVEAPTGSGKTLAAFLLALDGLLREAERGPLPDEVRVLYVSPLKALSNDVEKNLREPLAGLDPEGRIRAAVRTGDTPPAARARMARRPPHVLITTPESLYLLLTAASSRRALATVRTVIVDEVHALVGSKRGAHLALSLERLEDVVAGPLQRVGLSATVSPLEVVARSLAGQERDGSPRPCRVIEAGRGRPIDLAITAPGVPLGPVATLTVQDAAYDRIAELVRAHRTTIVFLKSRRLVERAGLELSERLGKEAVACHHGSLSRRVRLKAEKRLKAGEVKVVVATGSLELGIDVGSVDLVIQVESPGSTTTLLQRVGRSGHAVGALPKGRIVPLTIDDLVEASATVEAARAVELDALHVPRGGSDVLAQQLVAECALEERSEDDLFALARRAYPYRDLERRELDRLLELHAGPGPRGAAPLLHRDRASGTVRGRRAARLIALGSGGAIPERFNYDVVVASTGRKIGDLDEDFSVESSPGDIFVLGGTSWRIAGVRQGRVLVEDVGATPPTVPFWRGDAPGRTLGLSRRTAALRAEIGARLDDRATLERELASRCGLGEDDVAALVDYVAAGKAALGLVPDHRSLVVERFLDNAGGEQLVIHAPFGMRVNRAFGLALRKRFCVRFDFELQAAATDEGVLLSFGPRGGVPPLELPRLVTRAVARTTLEQAVRASPLFETLFRACATRSLAVARRVGGRAVPPPIQRMRTQDLLSLIFPAQTACQEAPPPYVELPDHPLIQETIREALEDTLDLAGLEAVLADLESGNLAVYGRELAAPSPFAHELLAAWNYAFLDDAPLEERRARQVTAHRGLLEHVLDPAARARVLDAAVVAEVAAEVSGTAPERRARDPRELLERLDAEAWLDEVALEGRAAGSAREWLLELERLGRAARLRIGTRDAWAAVSALPLLRAAYGSRLDAPAGEVSTAVDDARAELVRRRIAASAPVTSGEVALRLGLEPWEVLSALAGLEAGGVLLRGRFTREDEDEWCERRVLERIHARTLARLRRRARPVSARDHARFLLRWQRLDPEARARGDEEGLARVIGQLEGWELSARTWERGTLGLRVAGDVPRLLDALGLSGDVVWGRLAPRVGSSAASLTGPGRVALALRDDLGWLRAPGASPDVEATLGEAARAALERLRAAGPTFLPALARSLGLDDGRALLAVLELVRAGLVTGDGVGLLRGLACPRARRLVKRTLAGLPARGRLRVPGRVEVLAGPADEDDGALAWAEKLLERWGVVSRDVVLAERCAPRWRILRDVYRRLEAQGRVRRGRFVEGFPDEQYATEEAVERLRRLRRRREADEPSVVVVPSAEPLALVLLGNDPAKPRVRRLSGDRLAFSRGVATCALEGGELRWLRQADADVEQAIREALAAGATSAR